MPKMKTKSGAKKRFRVRGSGSIKRSQAFNRHILTKKTTKSKRHGGGVSESKEVVLATRGRAHGHSCWRPSAER